MNRYDYDGEYDDEQYPLLEAQDDADEEEEQAAESVPPVPLWLSLRYGLGTFCAAGLVDLVAHFGPTGLVVGGIAAYAASRHGPDLVEHFKEALPVARLAPAARSWTRRSRHVQDDDTLIVEEGERWQAERDWHPVPVVPTRRRGAGPLLHLAPDLHLPVHDLAGKAIFICGIRRQGKTTLGALLAEQLGQYCLPLVIPDAEGDYLSLAEVLPRAVIAAPSRLAGQYPAGQFVPLDDVQAAYQLGYDTLDYGYQVLLDLSAYQSLEEGIAIQVNLIRGLFHWTNTHPQERVPCQVYLDEAQRYLPQNLSDSVILHRGLLAQLLKCYMDIIGTGGKRGLAPVILTQRFAQVNNKIMAQSEVFFLLRQTHDTDLDRCMEYVDKTVASKEQIARFQPGQGVYIGSDGSQIVTQFAGRRSSGQRSQSPRPEAAARYAQMPLTPRYRPVTPGWDALPSESAAPPGDYRMPPLEPVVQAGAAPLPPVSHPVVPIQAERKPQPTPKDAILCWNELVEKGENPSRQRLQQALIAKGFECRENWARKFYEDIKAKLNQQEPEEQAGG